MNWSKFLAVFLFGIAKGLVSDLDNILISGVSNKTYPGVVAIAGNLEKNLYSGAHGSYFYVGDSDLKLTNINSKFDLASVSKVFASTSAVALLFQQGYIGIYDKISKYLGAEFDSNGKEGITVSNCLLHNAGFTPDPEPWYWDPQFGCPNTNSDSPQEDFSCMDMVYKSILSEELVQAPGLVYSYSDVGFEVLQMVVGQVVSSHNLVAFEKLRSDCQSALNSDQYATPGVEYSCYFEAFVRTRVFENVDAAHQWLPQTGYRIPQEQYGEALPTLNDTGEGSYTHKRIQGQVSDGDCYAMGGFCGHAGVFSTATDLAKFLQRMLVLAVPVDEAALQDSGHAHHEEMRWLQQQQESIGAHWLNASTVQYFTKEFNATQSSRALGWTTNDPNVADYGYNGSCGNMSAVTFMHTGYSGTCVCVDPVKKIWSVILTNRNYNCQGQLCPVGSSDPVKAIYKQFHNTLLETLKL